MQVERGLQLSLTILCVLSATMLGIGQGSVFAPLAMALTAGLAAVFIDRLGWITLPRIVGNAAMLGVAAITLVDFLKRDSDSQLVAIGNLLTYVQIILLVQAKNERVYGSLAVFSLLQVVVAALLNMGFLFGLLLIAYLLVAMAVLVFHGAYRDLLRFRPKVPEALPWPIRWLLSRWRAAPDSSAPIWKRLLDDVPNVTTNGDWQALDRQFSRIDLLRQAAALSIATLILAIGFFVAVPRSSGSTWQRYQRTIVHSVGFSTEIRLNQVGRLLQDNTPVLRVAFFDPQTREKVEVVGGPYLHGVALTEYSPRSGDATWAPRAPVGGLIRLPAPPSKSPVVIQDVVLEPARERNLFCVQPSFSGFPNTAGLGMQQFTRRLVQATGEELDSRQRRFRYVLGTTAIRNGDQSKFIPVSRTLDRGNDMVRSLTEFDVATQAPLRDLAQEILANESPHERSTIRIAQKLEMYLRTSVDYTYSLDLTQIPRQSGVDPVVDFAVNHRVGHCAYFASGLALMLRSQGIPARIVVGYQGGMYNDVGGYYLIRQSDAHAWVEAYLAPDEVPLNELAPGESAELGAWLRLDPTPPSRGERRRPVYERGVVDQIDDMMDYVQVLWTDHIVGLNRERQRRLIYRSLGYSSEAVANWGRNAWYQPLRAAAKSVGVSLPEPSFLDSQSSRGILALLILLLCSLGWLTYRWAPRSWRWVARKLRQTGANAPARKAQIAFYVEWETMLRRLNWQRALPQTAREFSRDAVVRMVERGAPPETYQLAEQVVTAFYRVRFGRATLDNGEREAIETALRRLHAILHEISPHKQSRPTRTQPPTRSLVPPDSSA